MNFNTFVLLNRYLMFIEMKVLTLSLYLSLRHCPFKIWTNLKLESYRFLPIHILSLSKNLHHNEIRKKTGRNLKT